MSISRILKSAFYGYLLVSNPTAVQSLFSSDANNETSILGNQCFDDLSNLSMSYPTYLDGSEDYFSDKDVKDLDSFLFNSMVDEENSWMSYISNLASTVYDSTCQLIWPSETLRNKLFEAIEDNNLDDVQKLIKKGVDVNYVNLDGESALMIAVKLGNLDIVCELIKAKADVNYVNSIGGRSLRYTPLIFAISNKNLGIIQVLIEANADVQPLKHWQFKEWIFPALIRALKQKDFQRVREEILHLSGSYFLKNPKEKLELNSWINPQIIEEYNLQSLDSDDSDDGKFKKAFIVPENQRSLIEGLPNKSIVILIFKENTINYSPKTIQEYLKTYLSQYKKAKEIFGSDRCVNIYNSETALEQKCLIAEKIPQSLKTILTDLQTKGMQRIASKDSLDENQQIALDLLRQLKDFYYLSIKNGIDGDFHIGNFRVKMDESNNYKLILTDFTESFDEDDLLANKRAQFSMFKKYLGTIFTSKFLENYFAESLKLLDEMS